MLSQKSNTLLSLRIHVSPSLVSAAIDAWTICILFKGEYESLKGFTVHLEPSTISNTRACFPIQETSACESIPRSDPDFRSSLVRRDLILFVDDIFE